MFEEASALDGTIRMCKLTQSDIAKKLGEVCELTVVDALSLATRAGNIKAVNVALIGVLAKASEIPYDAWVRALEATVPEKFLEANRRAFDLGYGV